MINVAITSSPFDSRTLTPPKGLINTAKGIIPNPQIMKQNSKITKKRGIVNIDIKPAVIYCPKTPKSTKFKILPTQTF